MAAKIESRETKQGFAVFSITDKWVEGKRTEVFEKVTPFFAWRGQAWDHYHGFGG